MKVSMCKTMRTYEWKNLSKDLLAGLVIMAVSIPISMGYAQIAGLPAVYGLYGSVFPIVLFALFSTSPQFVFGVDAGLPQPWSKTGRPRPAAIVRRPFPAPTSLLLRRHW